MKLVYLNGAFMIGGRDFRWELDRLVFDFTLCETDVISVVDLVRSKQTHYGVSHRNGGEPLERILDPVQKMAGENDGRRLGRGSGLPKLQVPEGDG